MEMAVAAATGATCRPITEATLHITDYSLHLVALNLVSIPITLTLLPSEEPRMVSWKLLIPIEAVGSLPDFAIKVQSQCDERRYN